jgi:hypothetical protein
LLIEFGGSDMTRVRPYVTYAFFILIVSIACLSMANPASGVQKENSTSTKKMPKPQLGSSENPLAVKMLPTDKSENDLAAEKAERDKKADQDQKLTDYTGKLADYTKSLAQYTRYLFLTGIGQLIILAAQIYFLNGSLAEAKAASGTATGTLEQMKINEKRQLRAHVFLKDMKIEVVNSNGLPHIYRFSPIWSNGGGTSAIDISIVTNWANSIGPLPKDFTYDLTGAYAKSTNMTLGPTSDGKSAFFDISAQDVHRTNQGKHLIYIWGVAEYADSYADNYRSQFCIVVDALHIGPNAFRVDWYPDGSFNMSV